MTKVIKVIELDRKSSGGSKATKITQAENSKEKVWGESRPSSLKYMLSPSQPMREMIRKSHMQTISLNIAFPNLSITSRSFGSTAPFQDFKKGRRL
ncbi:MAG: hypothetical protein ACE1ZI_00910 [Acidobacteriota bacterium]